MKIILTIIAILVVAFLVASIIAMLKKKSSVYGNEPKQKNPLEGKRVIFVPNETEPENADGVRGHLEAVGESQHKNGVYEKYIKRLLDIILSFGGLVLLSPVFLGIAIAIYIDDPGPIFFTQKRTGKKKQYFKLHKFRSMKMSTPNDKPTHMLENPEQYITKVGKFIRTHSLDELPQIWDIFIGNMSVIGPRPGLWNQDLLTAERDKYCANDVKPGLTGWAQINGRDELEISEKAKLDGEYAKNIGLKMDAKCFLGSLHVFGGDESVVEGGTGEMKKLSDIEPSFDSETVKAVTPIAKKKVLVIGTNSYIGSAVTDYLRETPEFYDVEKMQARGLEPKPELFKGYDVIFDAAGIAHIKETEENKQLYYQVNRDLTIKIAEAAKTAGVKQFIILSSMSVYGKTIGHITKITEPSPINAYGRSKMEADIALQKMECETFKVSVLRPPMVYGKGCKGNYQTLRSVALKSPIFPACQNQRSMIYIGNLCEFVKRVIDNETSGVYFPQNNEYVCTSEMVRRIANENNRSIVELSAFTPVIKILSLSVIKKVFGSLTYEKVDTINKFDFEQSMRFTESKNESSIDLDTYHYGDLVSIVMPAYNAEKTIRESIDSVLNQTYGNYELIIVNDCSLDATRAIIEEYISKDSRVILINNEVNSGVSYSRNTAIAKAKGKWIAFLDSDDLWREDKLVKQVKLMVDENAILSYTASAFIDSEGNSFNYILEAEQKTDFKTLLRKNLVSCSSAMIRTSVMKKIEMPNDKMHEDYYVWLTVLKSTKYAYGINEPLLVYRLSKNSKSSNRIKSAKMIFNTYYAVGYSKIKSGALTVRYSIHSITKRIDIKKSDI